MDRNLALEFVRVTEAAAIAAAHWVGRGNGKAADGAAVEAMRSRFNNVDFSGTVVIGEGKKDEAPELFVGEKLGTGQGPELDIAVDPLECTDSVANGRPNAISVIATGPAGSLFQAPDMYMDKIAVGPRAKGAVDLDAPVKENLRQVAGRLNKAVSDLTVIVMDRPRHTDLIKQIREVGARVLLITDGDLGACVATCNSESGIDMVIGVGGSAEGVLAAAAMKCLGGELITRLQPRNEAEISEARAMGITDLSRKLSIEDLAKGETLTFTATGVIDGPLLQGVRFTSGQIITHSVVMRVKSGTVRFLETHHKI